MAPCLLPKISGVVVTPSVTPVESSEQFWRKIRKNLAYLRTLPPAVCHRYPCHLYTWVKKDKVELSSLSKDTTHGRRLNPRHTDLEFEVSTTQPHTPPTKIISILPSWRRLVHITNPYP